MKRAALMFLALLAADGASAAGVGRRLPVEKRRLNDAVTGVTLEVLTSDPANDAKPYQTHPAWTADGQWIVFRSDRGGSGPQAFVVNERTGDIVQLTEGASNNLGSLNLARKSTAASTCARGSCHETVTGADEVMFNLMGHLPYLRERPTGLAVVNLRTSRMNVLDQIDEDLGGGRTGGLWHGNGSPDGRWAVADSFKGDVYLIDRRNGQRTLLTGGHEMRPDHAHPIFSADSRRVLIQSGRLTGGKSLDLMVVEIPERLLVR